MPALNDFGAGAILFIAFLTLKAWDIGGGGGEGRLPDSDAVARACAWIMVPIGVVVTLLRLVVFRRRFFIFSGAALLHALLNGFAGLSYLAAGAIAGGLAVVGAAVSIHRAGSAPAASGGAH